MYLIPADVPPGNSKDIGVLAFFKTVPTPSYTHKADDYGEKSV